MNSPDEIQMDGDLTMPNFDAMPDHSEATGQDDILSRPSAGRTTGWGWILAYSVLVILIGILALANPMATGLATGVLISVILLIYGGTAIAAGVSALSKRARWTEIALGVLALVAGGLVLLNPFAGALSLVWAVGAWLLVAGIFQIVSAFRAAHDRGWRLLLGVTDAVLGGLLLFSSPALGLAWLAVAVGISFLLRGFFLILLALGIRKLGQM